MNPIGLLAVVPDWLSNWLTPIWILSLGIVIGIALLGLLWLVVLTISRRAAADIWETSTEGVLQYVLWLAGFAFAVAVTGFLVVRDPGDILASVPRLPMSGTQAVEATVPPSDASLGFRTEDAVPLAVHFDGTELRAVHIEAGGLVVVSNRRLDANAMPGDDGTVKVEDNIPYDWFRAADVTAPFGTDRVEGLYAYNLSSEPVTVAVELNTAPVYPEVGAIPVAAISTAGLFLLFWILRVVTPKTSAIALATAKSEMAQPLFLIIVLFGAFALFVFLFIPYNTFGEDIKMLKDSGFTLLMILCIIQAVWAASSSVYEEVEGRTALTVLSKPIGRREFILGKYLGIVSLVALQFIVLGFVFLIVVSYKPIYDARETANYAPVWQQCHVEVMLTIPGLVLAFLETVVLAGLSVAISTRLPMLANFVICFTIYVLGHLTPLLVQSSVAAFEPVVFFGTLVATLIPVLDHFNIQAAVAAGVEVPGKYLFFALLYCLLYSAVAMLLALALFEDRDLA